MKPYIVLFKYPALHRCKVTVEAEEAVTSAGSTIDAANHSDA